MLFIWKINKYIFFKACLYLLFSTYFIKIMKIILKVVLIALYFFKGKFLYFYTFNTYICILTNIKPSDVIMVRSRLNLCLTLKTLNLSLLRFFEWSGFENHGVWMNLSTFSSVGRSAKWYYWFFTRWIPQKYVTKRESLEKI